MTQVQICADFHHRFRSVMIQGQINFRNCIQSVLGLMNKKKYMKLGQTLEFKYTHLIIKQKEIIKNKNIFTYIKFKQSKKKQKWFYLLAGRRWYLPPPRAGGGGGGPERAVGWGVLSVCTVASAWRGGADGGGGGGILLGLTPISIYV